MAASERPLVETEAAAPSAVASDCASEASSSQQQQRPQIIYALVTRCTSESPGGSKVVLAEYTAHQGNFQQGTLRILQKLDATAEWKSYTYGEYAFHYIIDSERGLWFVCMADKAVGRRQPFAFLAALQEAFVQRYGPAQCSTAIAYGMQAEFRRDMQALMTEYNTDRVASMTEKVKHIHDSLVGNAIPLLLARQEHIDILVDRCHMLSESSASFHRNVNRARRAMRWRDMRTTCVVILVVLLVVAIIVVAFCGVSMRHC